MVFRGNAKGLGRSTFNTEHQDTDADNAATNEQESLCYIHPYDGLHAAKQRQDDDGDAQHQDNAVDVDVEERRQCHRDKKEHRACLRKVAQRKGQRRIQAGKEPEAPLEVFIGRQADDLAEQRHDDADQCQQHDGHHQTLHQKYPVVGVCRARVGEECHT